MRWSPATRPSPMNRLRVSQEKRSSPGDRWPGAVHLDGERAALNFLQRLSGIATTAASYVARVNDLPVRILDTRKTVPGLHVLDKYAVAWGGAANHRLGSFGRAVRDRRHLGRRADPLARRARPELARPRTPAGRTGRPGGRRSASPPPSPGVRGARELAGSQRVWAAPSDPGSHRSAGSAPPGAGRTISCAHSSDHWIKGRRAW